MKTWFLVSIWPLLTLGTAVIFDSWLSNENKEQTLKSLLVTCACYVSAAVIFSLTQ